VSARYGSQHRRRIKYTGTVKLFVALSLSPTFALRDTKSKSDAKRMATKYAKGAATWTSTHLFARRQGYTLHRVGYIITTSPTAAKQQHIWGWRFRQTCGSITPSQPPGRICQEGYLGTVGRTIIQAVDPAERLEDQCFICRACDLIILFL
jgi:hypothetical protein